MVTNDGDDRFRATSAVTFQELLVVGSTRVKTTTERPMDAAVARELAETCTDELLDPHSGVSGECLYRGATSSGVMMMKAAIDAEITTRDDCRAKRYVQTVPDGREGERRERLHAAEEGGVLTSEEDGVLTSEEGGALTSEYGGVPVTEEGGMKTMEKNNRALETVVNTMLTIAPVVKTATEFMPLTTTVPVMATPSSTTRMTVTAPSEDAKETTMTTGCTMKLGNHPVPDRAHVAAVRLARKQAKRDAERHRVECAVRRATVMPVNDDEVVCAVVELEYGQRVWRQRQTDEALIELEERKQRRWTETQNQDQRNSQSARVSLVQRLGIAAVNVARGSGAEADEGLPTAVMELDGEKYDIKWDSCARYSVAGTDWMERGERVRGPAPVDYVEGVGCFLLDEVGVWAFEMRNVYGQVVRITACIIEGCTSEFLVGVDFKKEHKANMDFDKNEIFYHEKELLVVVPFRTEDNKNGETKIAVVRLARCAKLTRNAVTPVTIMVAAPDGETGRHASDHRDEGRWRQSTHPGKKELGVWVPLTKDMQMLELNGELEPDRIYKWLETLGDTKTPLDNEHEVRIGEDEAMTRALVLKLLRAYTIVSTNTGDCPPVTSLDIQHHINTGDTAPIMLKRRRQAQTEDAVIEDNVA
ncbi:hypothetical protein L914_15509 [Phytophthora nicotianae]|uniref:Uncharacterized protein n=1 Tax=Phytophthora nicotianae TaxID=4792 RepID=W2MR15_PHYNI|nr:hypothetical protein L914_15509 [Phytophthora nicotianae]